MPHIAYKDQLLEPLYPHYLPHYDPNEKIPPQGPFEHQDPGKNADPSYPNLLKNATKIDDLSPYVGTELDGVQLSQLSKEGLDELALLAAYRGCVVFRNQDFADVGFEKQLEIARHYGILQRHGWMPHPKGGSSEFTIVHDSKEDVRIRKNFANRSPIEFHVDQSAEAQPPGLTFFVVLESPPGVGGDTLFSSSVRAFERLSPKFRKRLEGLYAVHTTAGPVSRELRDNGDKSTVKRPIMTAEHPVVIVHPVTKQKALFVNKSYTQSIVGYDREESDYLIKFLYDHVAQGHDFMCRVRWEPGTVVVWDQRISQHSQTLDYEPGLRRHMFRLTPLANKPIPSKVEDDDE